MVCLAELIGQKSYLLPIIAHSRVKRADEIFFVFWAMLDMDGTVLVQSMFLVMILELNEC